MHTRTREMRYFAHYNGETVQLKNVWHDGHVSGAARHFTGSTPDGTLTQAARKIDYKIIRPSLHACDARCMSATGHNCECSCGGKNHGKIV